MLRILSGYSWQTKCTYVTDSSYEKTMPVLYDFTIAASVFRAKYHWCKVEWPNASIFKKDNNMPNPIIFTKKSIVLIKTYKTKKW